jgi:two-component system chemotaxis response regulator CheB
LPQSLLRILIVDDSALYRQLVRNVLRDVPNVEVVGLAKNGQEALELVEQLAPDLLTLDVLMPGLSGIDVLRELKQRKRPTKAIMLSSLTANGAQVTTDALLEGAFDFILKPSGSDAEQNRSALQSMLAEKIQTFREGQLGPAARGGEKAPASQAVRLDRDAERAEAPDQTMTRVEAIVIGTSTGGPVALRELLPRLPGDLPVPVLIVQHMPEGYTHSLAERLNQASELEVVEACEGMALEPGWAFIAPGGRQMKIAARGRQNVVRLTDDPPENSCRPSVDYLFRSAAATFGGRVLAVVLTGMGRDGMEGCRELKRHGAMVIAQHAEGCTVYGMPKAVAEGGLADRIVPLDKIAAVITARIRLANGTRKLT